MGRRTDIDWEAVQKDFRLGQLTLRQIAKNHNVSASAISRKAEKDHWVQDLSEEVKERTRAALLSNATQSNTEAVETAVQTNVALVREHRALIGRARAIADKQLGELEAAEGSLKDRSSVLVNASNSVKTLVGLERQAFGLEAEQQPTGLTVFERIERVIVDPATD